MSIEPTIKNEGPAGGLLGVLRELAAEQRKRESQCIHAPKAKAMYARRAEEIEAAIARAVCALGAASAAYNTHCDAVVSALNEARSGDASWSQQHADYTKGKRDALRDLLGSPNDRDEQRASTEK
jgi:hypothetical protein